jgi:hypothetical protein
MTIATIAGANTGPTHKELLDKVAELEAQVKKQSGLLRARRLALWLLAGALSFTVVSWCSLRIGHAQGQWDGYHACRTLYDDTRPMISEAPQAVRPGAVKR